MSTVKLPHISVGYDDTLQGSPIVLIHGHPFNRSMWRDQIEGLGHNYRVIVPDLRGYGETTVIPGKTLLSDFAQDLASFLDALHIDHIILGGLSMGGQIVMEFYRQFPERVRALILADTFAQVDTEQGQLNRLAIAERFLNEGMGASADEMLPKMISKRTLAEQPQVAARVREMMRTAPPQGAAAAAIGRCERMDYTPLLSQITVPTLVIVGSEDEFTPVSDAQFMVDRIPGSKLLVVDGMGHMPNLECPEVVNQAVLEFLKTAAI